eukprot:1780385-Amphidinium_carterae.2
MGIGQVQSICSKEGLRFLLHQSAAKLFPANTAWEGGAQGYRQASKVSEKVRFYVKFLVCFSQNLAPRCHVCLCPAQQRERERCGRSSPP